MFGRGTNASLLVSCVLAFCFYFPASFYFRPLKISRGKQNMRRSLQKKRLYTYTRVLSFWAVCWLVAAVVHPLGRKEDKGPATFN
jgi:hypothetical protein